MKFNLRRRPDFIIGRKSAGGAYLLRWYIIPKNRFFNIYLHKFLRDDDDRALHDHPWPSISIILSGGYIEHTNKTVKLRRAGHVTLRRATQAHRIELYKSNIWYNRYTGYQETIPAWTIFITGPKLREWGFHCPKGWRHWRDFTAGENGEEIGRGCE